MLKTLKIRGSELLFLLVGVTPCAYRRAKFELVMATKIRMASGTVGLCVFSPEMLYFLRVLIFQTNYEKDSVIILISFITLCSGTHAW